LWRSDISLGMLNWTNGEITTCRVLVPNNCTVDSCQSPCGYGRYIKVYIHTERYIEGPDIVLCHAYSILAASGCHYRLTHCTNICLSSQVVSLLRLRCMRLEQIGCYVTTADDLNICLVQQAQAVAWCPLWKLPPRQTNTSCQGSWSEGKT
jgi:hypothetical protein